MIINCEKCGSDYEIIETFGNSDVTSECPDCGHENKGKTINSEFYKEGTDTIPQAKKLDTAASVFRWIIGAIFILAAFSYFFMDGAEFATSSNPFPSYLMIFVAGLAIIPPMRFKTYPMINIVIFIICTALSIGSFYLF